MTLMQPAELDPPELIKTSQDLRRILPELTRGHRLAVDTESNSLHAYQEQVCLIQFSTAERDYLVDPLAIDDLSPLATVFSDPETEKIYHAAEYDIMTLKRDFGFEHKNLFDTYIAVRTLGWDRPGLADILDRVFSIEIKKRYQRANWGKRPLPKEMLDYARLDTHYLIPLREELVGQLEQVDRLQEAREAFHLQTKAPPHPNGFDPQGFWDLGDTRRLSGRQAAILRELYLFRDQEAKRRDTPSFKVMGNRALLALAEAEPRNRQHLMEVKGVSQRRVDRYGDELMSAIREGMRAEPPQRPSVPRTGDAVRERYERLRQWRKRTARQRGVDSDIVLPRDTLWDIAHANPQSAEELRAEMPLLPWRFDRYGEAILQELHG